MTSFYFIDVLLCTCIFILISLWYDMNDRKEIEKKHKKSRNSKELLNGLLFDSISPDFTLISCTLIYFHPSFLCPLIPSSWPIFFRQCLHSPLASPISILDILIVKTMHLVLFWKGGRVWELLSMYSIGLLYYALSCQCSWHLLSDNKECQD